jgi:hypothetical protein
MPLWQPERSWHPVRVVSWSSEERWSLAEGQLSGLSSPCCRVLADVPGLGDVEAPPRSSLSSEAEVESEPLGRARRRPSAEARAESEPWGQAERSSSSFGAEPESEPWGRAERSSSSSGANPESEPWVGRSGVSHGA